MNVEYALSFGVSANESLWKIELMHPTDASAKVLAWLPMNADDTQIGDTIDNIQVAAPGPKLIEVMGWLYNRITKYPYYWPYEGKPVDRYGYDFQVDLEADNKNASYVEISEIAYEIIKTKLNVQPPSTDGTVDVDIVNDKVDGGGVLIKLRITLDRAQPCSELNIAPFTKYPMELVSLMYEEDIKTFKPLKEIALPKKVYADSTKNFSQTTQSMHYQFPVVIANRFTLILRQRNAEKNTYLLNPDTLTKKELWDWISEREAEVTLDATDGYDTIPQAELDKQDQWTVYLEKYAQYKKDFLAWQKKLNVYKQKSVERQAKLAQASAAEKKYEKDMKEWRAEYKAALKKYQNQVDNYKAAVDKYNTDYARYQDNLKKYNEYVRDYNAWKKKWG
jgi:hypothetical protein